MISTFLWFDLWTAVVSIRIFMICFKYNLWFTIPCIVNCGEQVVSLAKQFYIYYLLSIVLWLVCDISGSQIHWSCSLMILLLLLIFLVPLMQGKIVLYICLKSHVCALLDITIMSLIDFICRFLFDENCPEYKYYKYRLSEEEKALPQSKDSQTLQSNVYWLQSFWFKLLAEVLLIRIIDKLQ